MSEPEQAPLDSLFHRGEQQVQTRLGVRDKMESAGQRVIREFMPDQHREFFAQLPFVVIGAVDAEGRPWASMLTGSPGFMSSPNPRRLRIDADLLAGDPLSDALSVGADIGLLGIEFQTRRRNRLNGPIVDNDPQGFTVQVAQSFGNCPKYINQRLYEFGKRTGGPSIPRSMKRLDAATTAIVNNADTFFIATYYHDKNQPRAQGADVSHRGGKPGFVRVDDVSTLTWPDFVGNYLFNTLGNLSVNPQAGLLFPGFETGDMLYLSGRGEIIWAGNDVASFAGAQRLVRFRIEQIVHLPQALPLRWQLKEFSPFLERTGSWKDADVKGSGVP